MTKQYIKLWIADYKEWLEAEEDDRELATSLLLDAFKIIKDINND